MKKYTILIWLLLVGCLGASATLQMDAKTNLLRLLNHAEHGKVERLNILYQLVQVTKVEPLVRTYYVNCLLKEAEDQNNNEYKCIAYMTHMFIAYNKYDVKAVNYWMKLLEPLARKEKLYDLMFQGKRCVIDFRMFSEEYELEEKEANEMLQEAKKLKSDIGVITAYQCLANVYFITYRSKEAIKVLTEAYKLAEKVKNHYLVLEINGALIEVFQDMDDSKNRLKYIKLQEKYIAQVLKEEPELKVEFDSNILDMYISFISYYTDNGDYISAEKYRCLAEELNIGKYSSYGIKYHKYCYDLYYATGDFEKALKEINTLLKLYEDVSAFSHNSESYIKASLFAHFGYYDQALALYKTLNIEKDSIQVSILNKQVEQVRENYNADNLSLEKQRINLYINLISILVVAIVVCIIIGLLIRSYRVQNSLRRSEQEMRDMAQEMELMNQAKERFLSCISANISQPLNVVVEGSLRLISDDEADQEERKKISDSITQTSAELMKLINNILDLSRLEAGMMKFSISELELVNFMNSLVTSLTTDDGPKIRTVLPNDEIFLNIDSNRLSELMMRLLSNADKDTEEIVFEVRLYTDGSNVECCASGVALDDAHPTQDTIIMNEISRLFVEYFKGSYHVEKGKCVIFSLPVNSSIK